MCATIFATNSCIWSEIRKLAIGLSDPRGDFSISISSEAVAITNCKAKEEQSQGNVANNNIS